MCPRGAAGGKIGQSTVDDLTMAANVRGDAFPKIRAGVALGEFKFAVGVCVGGGGAATRPAGSAWVP